MNKHTRRVLYLFLFLIFVLSACKRTQSDKTVIKKEANQMIEKALKKTVKKEQIKSYKYKDSFSNSSGNLAVNMDASVKLDIGAKYQSSE